jgi:GT2 family glycosyltransferase
VDETLACLASLRENTTVPHTITVVDDASDGVTQAALEQAAADAPWMRVIRNPENLGYTRSANLGLRQSSAEWVVLLNSDTLVTSGWLEGMLECALSDERIAMVGPVSNAASWQSAPELLLDDGRWKVNGFGEMDANAVADLVRSLSERAFPHVPLLNGFCTLMRRSVVLAVGGFDEEAFPVGYGEENDLCVRVAKAGHALAIADHVFIHHAKSASFGARRRAGLSRRGNAACAAKHPEVDFRKLQREMAECVPLIELRRRLAEALRGSEEVAAA